VRTVARRPARRDAAGDAASSAAGGAQQPPRIDAEARAPDTRGAVTSAIRSGGGGSFLASGLVLLTWH
jgi:hypothetical protein